MIKWINLTEFAKMLGVCINTFKSKYLPVVPPPQRQTGNRRYWTEQTVLETIDKIQRGELHTYNTQD